MCEGVITGSYLAAREVAEREITFKFTIKSRNVKGQPLKPKVKLYSKRTFNSLYNSDKEEL